MQTHKELITELYGECIHSSFKRLDRAAKISRIIISIDEDPSSRIENSAIINLRGVSTKLYFNLISTGENDGTASSWIQNAIDWSEPACIINMRKATHTGTQISKVPTLVALLLNSYSVLISIDDNRWPKTIQRSREEDRVHFCTNLNNNR